MKYLSPPRVEAVRIEVLSWGHRGDKKVERRVLLGVFDGDVSDSEIKKSIEKHDVTHRVLGSESVGSGFFVSRSIKSVSEGPIFESIDECCKLLSSGVTWDDIYEGSRIVGDMYDCLEV